MVVPRICLFVRNLALFWLRFSTAVCTHLFSVGLPRVVLVFLVVLFSCEGEGRVGHRWTCGCGVQERQLGCRLGGWLLHIAGRVGVKRLGDGNLGGTGWLLRSR